MKRILRNILTCILCIALLAGNISLPAQAAVADSYTADEIVDIIMERLDAEIAKRPVARKLEVDVSDMGILAESVLWESVREILFDRVLYNTLTRETH